MYTHSIYKILSTENSLLIQRNCIKCSINPIAPYNTTVYTINVISNWKLLFRIIFPVKQCHDYFKSTISDVFIWSISCLSILYGSFICIYIYYTLYVSNVEEKKKKTLYFYGTFIYTQCSTDRIYNIIVWKNSIHKPIEIIIYVQYYIWAVYNVKKELFFFFYYFFFL